MIFPEPVLIRAILKNEIDRFWEAVRASYTGQNFFVLSYRGPRGKPHLKLCREDQ